VAHADPQETAKRAGTIASDAAQKLTKGQRLLKFQKNLLEAKQRSVIESVRLHQVNQRLIETQGEITGFIHSAKRNFQAANQAAESDTTSPEPLAPIRAITHEEPEKFLSHTDFRIEQIQSQSLTEQLKEVREVLDKTPGQRAPSTKERGLTIGELLQLRAVPTSAAQPSEVSQRLISSLAMTTHPTSMTYRHKTGRPPSVIERMAYKSLRSLMRRNVRFVMGSTAENRNRGQVRTPIQPAKYLRRISDEEAHWPRHTEKEEDVGEPTQTHSH